MVIIHYRHEKGQHRLHRFHSGANQLITGTVPPDSTPWATGAELSTVVNNASGAIGVPCIDGVFSASEKNGGSGHFVDGRVAADCATACTSIIFSLFGLFLGSPILSEPEVGTVSVRPGSVIFGFLQAPILKFQTLQGCGTGPPSQRSLHPCSCYTA